MLTIMDSAFMRSKFSAVTYPLWTATAPEQINYASSESRTSTARSWISLIIIFIRKSRRSTKDILKRCQAVQMLIESCVVTLTSIGLIILSISHDETYFV